MPVGLAGGVAFLILEAPLAADGPGLGRNPLFRFHQCLRDPVVDFPACVLQIPLLIPCPLARDHEPAVAVKSFGYESVQPLETFRPHALNAFEINVDFDFGGNLVDVLPPRARSPNSPHLQRVTGNQYSPFYEDRIRHKSPKIATMDE
jgi:hypothetical protein